MNKFTLKTVLFFTLFAIAFASCTKDEDTDIPVITVNGNNPYILDTINSPFNDPGASTNEGTIISDYSGLYLNKRGEYTIYYSANDNDDNIGHGTRKVIVKNPSEILVGSYFVDVIDPSTGSIIDYYNDQINTDDYHNGRFHIMNLAAPCDNDQSVLGQYNWNNNTLDIPSQTYNNQTVSNNTGNPFGVTINGQDVSFTMDLTFDGTARRYFYHKNNGVAETNVMLVHAGNISLGIDMWIDNDKANNASLAEGTNSSYIVTNAWTRSVKIKEGGTCVDILPTIKYFDPGKYYSLYFLTDGSGVNSLLQLDDDLSATSNGKARVRFLNASASSGSVDLSFVGTSVVVQNISFGQNNVSEIDAGSYTFDVFNTGTTTSVLSGTVPANFEAGKVYSMYVYTPSSGPVSMKVIKNN